METPVPDSILIFPQGVYTLAIGNTTFQSLTMVVKGWDYPWWLKEGEFCYTWKMQLYMQQVVSTEPCCIEDYHDMFYGGGTTPIFCYINEMNKLIINLTHWIYVHNRRFVSPKILSNLVNVLHTHISSLDERSCSVWHQFFLKHYPTQQQISVLTIVWWQILHHMQQQKQHFWAWIILRDT